jgi:hypothetical protein
MSAVAARESRVDVGEQNLLADTSAAGDGLADGTGPDHDEYVCGHKEGPFLSSRVRCRVRPDIAAEWPSRAAALAMDTRQARSGLWISA